MTTTALQLEHDIVMGASTAHIVHVTPEIASGWLELNTKNRSMRQRDVDKYARDMAAGRWLMTGEAIKFDTTGSLIDGQHRLWAIVESGQAVRMMVVTGLEPETQSMMDSGTKRTAADALNLAGFTSPNNIAAVARIGLAYDAGQLVRARSTISTNEVPSPSHAEIRQWVDLNPYVIDAVRLTGRWNGRSKSAAAAALVILSRIDADEALQFINRIIELDFDGSGDPAKALLQRLQHSKDQREHLSSVTELHLIFRAWNANRDGQQITKLVIRSPKSPFEVPR